MLGMHRVTGQSLDGVEHLRQSIADILLTPIGSRVMRRDYGSLLPELIDQPLIGATVLRVYAAVALALMRWEPRLRLTAVTATLGSAGELTLELTGTRTDTGTGGDALLVLTVPLRCPAVS